MLTYLDFEKPIAELEARVAELRETANSSADLDIDVGERGIAARVVGVLPGFFAEAHQHRKRELR